MLGSGISLESLAGSRWLPCLAAVACLVGAVGCDSVRRGSQRVEIRVTSLSSGHPVVNAPVTCAPTKRQGPTTLYDLSVGRYLDGFSDKSQMTDSSGRAVFPLDIFTFRGGLLVWLRLDRLRLADSVTGETYFFRIEQGARETLTVRMVRGESAKGQRYVVTVDAISPPSVRIDDPPTALPKGF